MHAGQGEQALRVRTWARRAWCLPRGVLAASLDHEIPGIGHDLPALGDYLASWRGRLNYRDTQTGASVAYDQARGTLIVQNSYMIHAYQYSCDSFVNGGRFVLP